MPVFTGQSLELLSKEVANYIDLSDSTINSLVAEQGEDFAIKGCPFS